MEVNNDMVIDTIKLDNYNIVYEIISKIVRHSDDPDEIQALSELCVDYANNQ